MTEGGRGLQHFFAFRFSVQRQSLDYCSRTNATDRLFLLSVKSYSTRGMGRLAQSSMQELNQRIEASFTS